jgi:hypothetical protein
MRKIDKTIILSTSYKAWLDTFKTKKHILYRADYPYYNDVVMNLFYCQNGLCAYTEQQLCPKNYYQSINWIDKEEKYLDEQTKKKIKIIRKIFDKAIFDAPKVFNGELDHFDASLKTEKGWDWDNFFMIDADTNNRKGTQAIDYRLKPDTENYDPFVVFDYSRDSHIFIVNTDFPLENEEERKRLQYIIDNVLGINFPNLIDKRRKELNKRMKKLELGIPFDETEENEFPTAFEFCKRIPKNNLKPNFQ